MLPEVCLETARREVVAPPVGLSVGLWEGPVGEPILASLLGKHPIWRGGDGDLAGKAHGQLAPLEQRRTLDVLSVPQPLGCEWVLQE